MICWVYLLHQSYKTFYTIVIVTQWSTKYLCTSYWKGKRYLLCICTESLCDWMPSLDSSLTVSGIKFPENMEILSYPNKYLNTACCNNVVLLLKRSLKLFHCLFVSCVEVLQLAGTVTLNTYCVSYFTMKLSQWASERCLYLCSRLLFADSGDARSNWAGIVLSIGTGQAGEFLVQSCTILGVAVNSRNNNVSGYFV